MPRYTAVLAGCEAFLALADVQETHDAYRAEKRWNYRAYDEYDEYEYDGSDYSDTAASDGEYQIHNLINSAVTLTHWTVEDGARLDEIALHVADGEVCASTPSGDLAPYSQEYEGYMGNWGNTLDRWYHRAAIIIWPQNRAFANRAETAPAWALDELAAMASSGEVAGARTAAASLAPFWNGTWTEHTAKAKGPVSELFSKALRAADLVDDAETAALLLRPFRIGSLTRSSAKPFANLAESYGQEWATKQLWSWLGSDSAWIYSYGRDVQRWVTDQLPGLCKALYSASGRHSAAARPLLDVVRQQIGHSIQSALAWSPPSYRDSHLQDFGGPLAALLKGVTITGAADIRDSVSAFIRQQDDSVLVLEIAALRAAAGSPKFDASGDAGFMDLAEDCAERLRARLTRPIRDAGDWSIEPPDNGCPCQPCGTLDTFLAAADSRTIEWPLAEFGREHLQARIDRAELPVTYTTKRLGRPYTLVLTKSDALFTSEHDARARDEADLAWLHGIWATAPATGN
jgi:hypothetical protein